MGGILAPISIDTLLLPLTKNDFSADYILMSLNNVYCYVGLAAHSSNRWMMNPN